MMQTREIALNDAGLNSAGSSAEMYSLENEYADVWVKGNAGEPLTDAEASIYKNLIRNRTNRVFWEGIAFNRLGAAQNIALANFVTFLHQNPGARSQWEKNDDVATLYRKAQYPDYEPGDFGKNIRAQLSRLDDFARESRQQQ